MGGNNEVLEIDVTGSADVNITESTTPIEGNVLSVSMWHLMEVFGDDMHLGAKPCFVGGDISLDIGISDNAKTKD